MLGWTNQHPDAGMNKPAPDAGYPRPFFFASFLKKKDEI
jgi:hypothetical protein